MALLEADLTEGTKLTAIEEKTVIGFINMTPEDRTAKSNLSSMIAFTVEVEEPMEFAGRILPAGPNSRHNITYKGQYQDKKTGALTKMNLGGLYDAINALKVEWTCGSCKVTSDAKFIVEKGHYHCPACGASAKVTFDTDTWVGKRARFNISIRKSNNSDDMFNQIDKILPLD